MSTTYGTWVDKPWARRLGDAADETELPDADIPDPNGKKGLDSLALSAESDLGQVLQKFDWTPADPAWPSIQEISSYLTAAMIIDLLYSDEGHLKKAAAYREHAGMMIDKVVASMGTTGDNPAIFVSSSNYITKGMYDQTHSDNAVAEYLSDF